MSLSNHPLGNLDHQNGETSDTATAKTDIPALWESAEGLCSPATLVSTRGVLYTPHGHRLSRSDSPPEIVLGWGCLDGFANVYHVPGVDHSVFLVPVGCETV